MNCAEVVSIAKITSILLVEDNEKLRDTVSELLDESGYVCDAASGGLQAIAKLSAQTRYDVILLDVNMPDVDGFFVASSIRNKACINQSTPIVWISATMPDMFLNLFKSKCTNEDLHYLQKPIVMSELREMFRTIALQAV